MLLVVGPSGRVFAYGAIPIVMQLPYLSPIFMEEEHMSPFFLLFNFVFMQKPTKRTIELVRWLRECR